MKYYQVEEWENPKHTGCLNAARKWILPGMSDCPTCGAASIVAMGAEYPCVDLSPLPRRDLSILEEGDQVPFPEFARLREAVRPYVPPNACLLPGTAFGPLIGKGTGWFAEMYRGLWTMCLRVEAWQQLSKAGIRGILACPAQIQFSRRGIELVSLQIEVHGRFSIPDRRPECQCGNNFIDKPPPLVLARQTLPTHVDIFRLLDSPSRIIANERFVDTTRSLHMEGVTFREMKVEG